MRRKLKILLISFASGAALCAVCIGAWLVNLDNEISEKLSTKQFLPPTEFYSAPFVIWQGEHWAPPDLIKKLKERGYVEALTQDQLRSGSFFMGSDLTLFVRLQDTQDPDFSDAQKRLQIVVWHEDGETIDKIFWGPAREPALFFWLEPELFAQYLGTTPVLQTWKPLGETPALCLNAVLSIEDAKYLEHSGVSFLGILRAAVVNLLRGRAAQGGSTITQQMVKNYFLTSEKTLRRKLKEIVMALLLEAHANKDQIFETYLNIIYMGQSGPFEVRGFAAAARHYFGKDLETLNLSECSLLAALLNSPGTFDPIRKPEAAKKRRDRVLDKMLELRHITQTEFLEAKNSPLAQHPQKAISETAPYYTQVAINELQEKNLPTQGVRVFTGLDLDAQSAAQSAVQEQIKKLEATHMEVKKINARQGSLLEGMLLSEDLRTGWVRAAVGGRSFRKTQFNRILQSHRQVGSLMKPFVFWTALDKNRELSPISITQDSRFTTEYEGQSWSPENYGKKYFGEVPLYFALKNSLNASTAQIGLKAGLQNIIETTKQAGVTQSPLKPYPSLTLGAFELFPIEILKIYSTLARFGTRQDPTWVRALVATNGTLLYKNRSISTPTLDSKITAQVVGMLKQTVLSGTAVAITQARLPIIAAGKTGTTSDYKDAWFEGFTPTVNTLAWVGFDLNERTGLTGATGAIPIWIQYMKSTTNHEKPRDFQWPPGVHEKTILDLDGKTELSLIFLDQ